jgi:hypothetical protein
VSGVPLGPVGAGGYTARGEEVTGCGVEVVDGAGGRSSWHVPIVGHCAVLCRAGRGPGSVRSGRCRSPFIAWCPGDRITGPKVIPGREAAGVAAIFVGRLFEYVF